MATPVAASTPQDSAAAPTPAGAGEAVLVGAGDIAACDGSGDEETAALLDDINGIVFTAGDNTYPDGTWTTSSTATPNREVGTWGVRGQRRGITSTTPTGRARTTSHLGSAAAAGYYAFDLGKWRIYSLDNERISDEQLDRLAADLAHNPRGCVLASWHRPRFSSGIHGGDPSVDPLWSALAGPEWTWW